MPNERYYSPDADAMLETEVPVLDKGSITLLDYSGNDRAIEDAARVSFTGGDGEERTYEQRRGLIRYLMRHHHTTPFEMVELKFRVVCPIFVWRQWIRHRTANVNEISGRYAQLPDACYVPEVERLQKQAQSNKQGSAKELVDAPDLVRRDIEKKQGELREQYDHLLDHGLAKELARINVPVAQYTSAVWKIDLHNLFHFLRLRLDTHAQHEIRVYAEAMVPMVQAIAPIAWESFEDFRMHSMMFSRDEIKALAELARQGYDGEGVIPFELDMFKTEREEAEFRAKVAHFFEQ